MAIPHHPFDAVRYGVGHVHLDRRLIAASRVELVGFAGRTCLMGGHDRALPRAHGLIRERGGECDTARRVLRGFEDDLLVHMFQTVVLCQWHHVRLSYMQHCSIVSNRPRAALFRARAAHPEKRAYTGHGVEQRIHVVHCVVHTE